MYALITRISDPDERSPHLEVEFFSERPKTWNHPDNWPSEYELYEGELDGGDSILIESKIKGSPRMEWMPRN